MKNSVGYLFIFIILCLSNGAFSQEVGINILQQPAIMSTNSTGAIRVDICNNDANPVFLPAYKIRPLISVQSGVITITGVSDLPAGWSICSNDGTNIRLSNGSDGTLNSGDCYTFFINVASNTTLNSGSPITATLAFGGGTAATACNSGPQTVGNEVGNDNSSSSVTVVAALPLDFTGINAAWNSNDAVVNWEVAREMNNEYFSIERSFDGKSFTQVGTVRSIGNHKEAAKYTYTDNGAKERTMDKVAYRVKQMDYNGKSTTSKIVWLTNKGKSNNAYIYPNPVTANKTFAFVYENNDNGSGDLIINILDVHGKLVYTTTMPIVKGKNETVINVSALAVGAYFLKYDNESLNINGTIRLIKD